MDKYRMEVEREKEREYRENSQGITIRKILRAFNRHFLTLRVKLLLAFYIIATSSLFFLTPIGAFMAFSLPFIGILLVYGFLKRGTTENFMLSPKYFWLPGNAFNTKDD